MLKKLFSINIFRTKKTISPLVNQQNLLQDQIQQQNNNTNEETMGEFLNRNYQNIKNNTYNSLDYLNELQDIFNNVSIEYNIKKGNIGFSLLDGFYKKKYVLYLFNNSINQKNVDFYAIWGVRPDGSRTNIIKKAKYNNDKVYIFEDGFLYNIFPMIAREREFG